MRIRSLNGVLLAVSLAMPAIGSAHEPLLDPGALEAERVWSTPLWRGLVGPSDPHIRATFEYEVARLDEAEEETLDPEAAVATAEPLDAPTEQATPAEAPATAEAPVAAPQSRPWPYSVSIGAPNRGWLAYGVAIPEGKAFTVRPGVNFATQEAADAIIAAADAVHAQFPDTPRLHIGDVSRKKGGKLKRHLSHQSGRDADIAYYLKRGHDASNLKRASRHTIDPARNWVFIASLLADDKVEYIFSDRRLIPVLKRYARDVAKVSPELLEAYFGSGKKAGIIRHLRGHADHIHVRFKAPQSIAAVREYVKRHGLEAIKPLPVYTRVRRGDSLWKLSRRHRTSIKKLTRWNRISRRKVLRPGQKLIIGWKRPSLPEVDGGT